MRIIEKKASTVQELIDLLQSLPEEAKEYELVLDYALHLDKTTSIFIIDEHKQLLLTGDPDSVMELLKDQNSQGVVHDEKICYIKGEYVKTDVCMSEFLRSLLKDGWFITDAEIEELLKWSGESDVCVDDIRERKGKGA